MCAACGVCTRTSVVQFTSPPPQRVEIVPDLLAVSVRRSSGDARPSALAAVQRDGDARVAVGDDADRNDVLQYQTRDREELLRGRLRPVLVTDVHVLFVVGDRFRNRRYLDGQYIIRRIIIINSPRGPCYRVDCRGTFATGRT